MAPESSSRVPFLPIIPTILTPEAVAFVARLQRKFGARRIELLQRRVERQKQLDKGVMPDFLPETAQVRADASWRVKPVTNADLQDRRVEITGPVDRKMVINALNSGADVFMADFEDANARRWSNHLTARSTCATRFAAPSIRHRDREAYRAER